MRATTAGDDAMAPTSWQAHKPYHLPVGDKLTVETGGNRATVEVYNLVISPPRVEAISPWLKRLKVNPVSVCNK